MYDHEMSGPLDLDSIEDFFNLPESQFSEPVHSPVIFDSHGSNAGAPGHGHSESGPHHPFSSESMAEREFRNHIEAHHNRIDGSFAGNSSSINPTDIFHSPMMGPVNVDGTPLLSPQSVADHHHFQTDFAIPPSYFSPTMSPAIEPADGGSGRSHTQRARRSVGNIPRVAKQSPSMRPRRSRRASVSKSVSASLEGSPVTAGSAAGSATATPNSARPTHMSEPGTPGGHSSDGISPASLSQSATSPILKTESDESDAGRSGPPPPAATPARLMNLPGTSGRLKETEAADQVEERLNMAIMATSAIPQGRNASGSPISPNSTPGIAPRLVNGDRRYSNVSQASVSSATTPAIRPRLNRHGSRASSTSTSPAILPAIASPGMPARGNDSDLAVMLANKSNYQNLLEGNHHHLGLQYPDRLSSDLSTKKASHKIAEQERRNRINTAIVELGKIIAPDAPMGSKAATVEASIDFIRDMQARIQVLEKQLEER